MRGLRSPGPTQRGRGGPRALRILCWSAAAAARGGATSCAQPSSPAGRPASLRARSGGPCVLVDPRPVPDFGLVDCAEFGGARARWRPAAWPPAGPRCCACCGTSRQPPDPPSSLRRWTKGGGERHGHGDDDRVLHENVSWCKAGNRPAQRRGPTVTTAEKLLPTPRRRGADHAGGSARKPVPTTWPDARDEPAARRAIPLQPAGDILKSAARESSLGCPVFHSGFFEVEVHGKLLFRRRCATHIRPVPQPKEIRDASAFQVP